MSTVDDGIVDTDEGAQLMASRKGMNAEELLREVGCVLRLSEAEAADLEAGPGEDETMIINMGPQHPSTHGVLNIVVQLSGETIVKADTTIGLSLIHI